MSDELSQQIPGDFHRVFPLGSDWTRMDRRCLPHLEHPLATYFTTFRTKGRWKMPPRGRDVALSAVTHWNGKRIDLDAAVIMPDHVHMIFRVTAGSELAKILHGIKSFSANEINRLLDRHGNAWKHEGFDHIIRHEAEWEDKVKYVILNPVKAGLAERPDEYPWLWLRKELRPGEI